MKHSNLIIFLLLLLALGAGTACKKYPEGGRIKKANKSLRGGLNDEYLKQWKVTKYEVDGVDSTKIWKKGKSTDRFSYYDVQISPISTGLKIETEVILLVALLNDDKTILSVGEAESSLEAINCYRNNICERNIFIPDGAAVCAWEIRQLDKDKLKMNYVGKKNYVIEMENAD